MNILEINGNIYIAKSNSKYNRESLVSVELILDKMLIFDHKYSYKNYHENLKYKDLNFPYISLLIINFIELCMFDV